MSTTAEPLYSIGVDFGTLSGRAVLVDVASGDIVATSVLDYPHGVMSRHLPSGRELPADWALQHPFDYVEVLATTIPDVLATADVDGSRVVGLGLDFTACTVLPILADGTPLCTLAEFADEPHAFVKLWKHHAAQPYATRITEVAEARGEAWLSRYGGRISSEWMFPKIWETLDLAPAVYARADEFIEAGDWVIRQLTGVPVRSAALAGYKAMWDAESGFPDNSFWAAVESGLVGVGAKLPGPFRPAGSRAGSLLPEMAALTGLPVGTPVAVANSDAYVSAPALGVTGTGDLFSIVGTSSCTLILDESFRPVPGISGCVHDGILSGFFGYEAGQAAVGDIFAWFVRESVPASYVEEARRLGLDIFVYLESLARELAPGANGLVALDWWNGNRSVLVDAELSGLLVGLTLQTTAAEVYRALLESVAFGMRTIVDTFVEHGVAVDTMTVTGGISQKSPLLMQIYADVTGREIRASQLAIGPALGSAIFGAVAAGLAGRGYSTISEAAAAMASRDDIRYLPDQGRHRAYGELYEQYVQLHEHFGRGGSDVMRALRRISAAARE
ncbi:ribulokinase [Herbiconiux moechotypicola]|uniref:Ribulokinase n=1 Tax=Herbiconiux moechotypicola TaxID=637393 RepID=A0ABP5QP28_9MICO|nr:ribulokinase [Herbiconiux moechotypicola]MCS5731677.1 ribulokinase [Herbiconiux moechotypicola]